MEQIKHTPGPWKRVDGRLLGADGSDVVLAGSWLAHGADRGSGTEKANTAIAESAPELLAELRKLVEIAEETMLVANSEGAAWNIDSELSASRAAISKAIGA